MDNTINEFDEKHMKKKNSINKKISSFDIK